MPLLQTNNFAQSNLAGAITNVATTANLTSGSGVLFPAPANGQYYVLTLNDAGTGLDYEIVHVTGMSGDTITSMVRAQEGTTALNWSAGDLVFIVPTAGQQEVLAQILVYAGNPNTHVAGVAASGGFPPTFCWDTTDAVLYACTSTGNAAGAVWTSTSSGQTVTFTEYAGNPNGNVAGQATIPQSYCWDTADKILYACIQTGTTTTAVWYAVSSLSPISGPVSFYVNASTGVDTPSGGASGAPWRTLQYAYNQIATHTNLNGYTATINCTGAFPVGVNATLPIIGSQGVGSVIWNLANGASVAVTLASCFLASAQGVAFTVQSAGAATLTATGSGALQGCGFLTQGGGQISLGAGLTFGRTDSGAFNSTGAGSVIFISSSFTTTGSAFFLFQGQSLGQVQIASGVTCTINTTPAYSQAAALANTLGLVNLAAPSAITFVGAATGPEYLAEGNGVINTVGSGGGLFPGSSGGSVATGGQYL